MGSAFWVLLVYRHRVNEIGHTLIKRRACLVKILYVTKPFLHFFYVTTFAVYLKTGDFIYEANFSFTNDGVGRGGL